MGDARRLKKKYKKPKVRYDAERIKIEKQLLQKYGLKNKKEIWKAESEVKRIRSEAKRLLTASLEEQERFLERLSKQGLLKAKTVDDVLELKVENILDRRLQTIVAKKFGLKPKQARQFITHGHVRISGRKVDIPSYFVDIETENKITLDLKQNG